MQWAVLRASNPVITTNFRPHTAALLHLVTRLLPDIPVIWVDSGLNTPETYRYVETITKHLALNLQVYTPRVTTARRMAVFNGVPDLTHPEHHAFTQEVKLEPFERAFREHQPDIWFTGIRSDQNAFRQSLGIVSTGAFGTTRVAPVFHWTEVDLEDYLYEHKLPDNPVYSDPTKVRDDRECGLQHLGSGI
ncbi:MAG: phosphoadenylylsulfate reductase [Gammaproteobacteria bacterium]|nr:phosphoadenylylsulfate reductase [Gammaproteobacteria bacterium]